MTTRTGKIARLPLEMREELNQRLLNGETGTQLLAWVNSQPETKRVLAETFGGRKINHPNLTAWRAGGFQDWLAERALEKQACHWAANPEALQAAGNQGMAEQLVTKLAVRYADLLMKWKGEVTPELQRKLRALSSLREGTVALCQIDLQCTSATLDEKLSEFKTRMEGGK